MDGVPDEQASERLRQRMVEVQQDALLEARRSLALLVVHSERASALLVDMPALQRDADARRAIAALQAAMPRIGRARRRRAL